MELSCSNIIFFIFFLSFDKRQPRKKIIVFQETETLKGLLIFQGIELLSPSSKKFPILLETEAPKKSLIFSQKKTVLIFQEKNPPPPPIPKKKKILYISGNGTFLDFRKRTS